MLVDTQSHDIYKGRRQIFCVMEKGRLNCYPWQDGMDLMGSGFHRKVISANDSFISIFEITQQSGVTDMSAQGKKKKRKPRPKPK